MNPYTSFWTGVREGDGPREFHLVLLDNGRADVLADEVGRQALRCIRCSACLNVCPVYSRVGGHAYESVYPGPIGAILTPQLHRLEDARSLPYASSLCGACYEVCPVEIDIPRVLVHLRGRVAETDPPWKPEKLAMRAPYLAFASRPRFERAQRLARRGAPLAKLPWPLSGWKSTRDLPTPPEETFREWWVRERGDQPSAPAPPPFDPAPLGPEPLGDHTGDARAAVLGRIRAALGPGAEAPEVPRGYRRRSERAAEESVELFAERAADYRATVHRAGAGDVGRVVAVLCAERGARRMAVPAGLPAEWLPASVEPVEDHALGPHELDGLDGTLTACALAIAETGVIVLDGGAGQGRRALTLVPDFHVCVVRAEQVVDLVPEAFERLGPAIGAGRPLTFIAGPSATSDIELSRVEGVHGPRTLKIVLAA
jgi:L-lactate utilization protein LutC/ferredoxin